MATIVDVATDCGVSITTVSTVLTNSSRPVSAATRNKVQEAARRLNYHANSTAQGLVQRRTNAIGILAGVFNAVQTLTNPYASGLMSGVLRVAGENNYVASVCPQDWHGAHESAALYRDGRNDGFIIVAPTQGSDMVEAFSDSGLKFVVIASDPNLNVTSVDVDDAMGARLAAQYLLSLGHTRIAHFMGNQDVPSVPVRREGFRAALAAQGVEIAEHHWVQSSYDASDTAELARQVLKQLDAPTAIFAGNDSIALAILKTALSMGKRVPQDLSIIGFDDMPFASMVTPALTTIHQPLDQIGAMAARLLIDQIEGKSSTPGRHLLPPRLVERGTTAPLENSRHLQAQTTDLALKNHSLDNRATQRCLNVQFTCDTKKDGIAITKDTK